MKNLDKRIITLFLILFLVLFTISACSNSKNETSGKSIFSWLFKSASPEPDESITKCTPGSLKSGTQCLVCGSTGNHYFKDSRKCLGNQICNLQGQCEWVGSLYAVSNPSSANLYVDTLYKGLTPIRVDGLNIGPHEVKISKDSRYYDSNMNVTIIANNITYINVTLIKVIINNTINFTIDLPPTVSASHSPLNPVIGGDVSLTATANDDKGLRSIQLIKGNGLIYKTCAYNQPYPKIAACTNVLFNLTNGTYTYYGKAIDISNQTSTSSLDLFTPSKNNTNTSVQSKIFY